MGVKRASQKSRFVKCRNGGYKYHESIAVQGVGGAPHHTIPYQYHESYGNVVAKARSKIWEAKATSLARGEEDELGERLKAAWRVIVPPTAVFAALVCALFAPLALPACCTSRSPPSHRRSRERPETGHYDRAARREDRCLPQAFAKQHSVASRNITPAAFDPPAGASSLPRSSARSSAAPTRSRARSAP
jgi:hypothetical protein